MREGWEYKKLGYSMAIITSSNWKGCDNAVLV